MAEVSIPSFTLGLGGMALVLNGMAKQTFRTTAALAKMGVLDKMFGGMQLAMEPLVPIPGQLLNAIIKMTTASLPVVIRMNQAFAKWADTMTYRINSAFNDGTLQAGIQRSADSIVNFFRSIANNPQFTEFMDRIKANGPAMAEAFSNIAEAAMKIVNALAPVNGMIIAIANAFAQFINALPVEVLSLVIAKLVLFKSALLISALVLKLSDAFLLLRTALFYVNNQAAMTALITPRLAAMGLAAPAIARVATAMRLLGKAISGVLIITTIFWVFDAIKDRAQGAAPDVDKLSTSLKNLATTGKATGEFRKTFGDIDGFVERLDKLNKKMREHKKDLETGVFGIDTPLDDFGQWIADGIQGMTDGEDALDALKADFKSLDQAFADLVNSGYGKLAAKDMGILTAAWTDAGFDLKDLKAQFPEYKAAIEAAEAAQKVAADSMGVFGAKAGEVSERIATLKQETEGLVKSLFELNGIQRDANQAVRDTKQAAEAMVKATKARHLNLQFVNGQLIQNTKAEQDAAASMEDFASKTEKSALATYTATGSWDQANKILTDNKAALIKAAEAAGMSTEQAKLYAESILKIPSKKEIQLIVADQASGQLKAVAEAYRAAPDEKTIKVTALNTAAVQALQNMGYQVRQLPDGQFEVTANTAPAEADLKYIENYKIDPKMVEVLARITELTIEIDEAQAKVDSLKQKRKTAVGADKKKLDAEIEKAQKKVDGLKQKRAAEIKALDKTKEGVDKAKANIDSVKDKKVTITVLTSLANDPAASAADAIRRQAERFGGSTKWAGGVIRRAHGGAVGGFVSGPGGPKSDKIQALLSNGEYVIRASSVNKYGMGMMNAINQGRWPRFAEGGAVKGTGGASAGSGVRAGETTGTFTVKDGTGKPVASAVQNFKALRTALGQTYADMNAKTSVFATQFTQRSDETFKGATGAASRFSRDQVSSLTSTRNKSNSVWNGFKSGMTARTGQTYKAIQNQTTGFQRSQVTATTRTSQTTQAAWGTWRTGMINRTNSTYKTLNNATSAFSKNSVSRIAGARDGMGSAWGGLSPRFKPPVSYLIHTVLNKGMVGSMNAMMSKLGGGKKVSGVSVAGFATGGPVYGAGTKTSDSIPARLSNGEFVMQAKAVDKFGVGFMNHVNQGKLPKDGAGFTGFSKGGGVNIKMAAPGFATGGSVGVPSAEALNKILGDGDSIGIKRMTDFIMDNYVLPLIDSGPGGSAMKDVQRAGMNHIRSNVEAFVKDNFGGAGSAAAGLRWAKTQHGKPYQWGGNGNPSWDCSGFMSAIESVIRGEKPHRRWSTHAFQGGAPSGWKAGANRPFRVGITHAGVGHTAGTIGKTNVESSGNGVQVGSGARGYNHPMFTSWYGYVGPNATKKARGGPIRGKGTATSDSIPAWLSNGEYVIRAAAARKLGTGYLNALNTGRIPGFAAGGKVSTTSAGTRYTIARGDTLSEIAERFNTTVGVLMNLNTTIKNANKIYAGQTIWLKKIASGGSGSGGSTGGSSGGGFTLGNFSKVGKSGIQSNEALAVLKNWVTHSRESGLAGATGSETTNAFKAHESTAELIADMRDVAAKIKAAFKGSAETKMIAAYNKASAAAIAYQKKLDPINRSLETAKEKLADLKESFDSMKKSVSDAILDFGKVTKIGTYGTSGDTLLNQLQKDVTRSGDFAKQLEKLKEKGVDSTIISQIAEAGITGGGAATAQTILNMTPEQLKKLNELQAQLKANADKAGTAAANAMYGAGIQAAQGLVDGLTAQKKAIEDKMMEIAKAMEKAIKQALGIKSPSRVMIQVADFTADGLVNQLIARKADAEKAIVDLVHPGTRAISGTTPAVTTGTMGYGSAGTTVHIDNIHVHVSGTFALDSKRDRESLARALAKDIKEEIRKDDKKRK